MNEPELIRLLDQHDAWIVRCASGELGLEAFLECYNDFPQRWALDGHESDAAGRATLQRHAERIEVHRRVWDEMPASRAAGFFGPTAAVEHLRQIVATFPSSRS